jgi:hypothetical protein
MFIFLGFEYESQNFAMFPICVDVASYLAILQLIPKFGSQPFSKLLFFLVKTIISSRGLPIKTFGPRDHYDLTLSNYL